MFYAGLIDKFPIKVLAIQQGNDLSKLAGTYCTYRRQFGLWTYAPPIPALESQSPCATLPGL